MWFRLRRGECGAKGAIIFLPPDCISSKLENVSKSTFSSEEGTYSTSDISSSTGAGLDGTAEETSGAPGAASAAAAAEAAEGSGQEVTHVLRHSLCLLARLTILPANTIARTGLAPVAQLLSNGTKSGLVAI